MSQCNNIQQIKYVLTDQLHIAFTVVLSIITISLRIYAGNNIF